MVRIKDFGAAGEVEITILVDNRADLIVKSTDSVKYFTDKPLLAEHGYAALVDLKSAGLRVLWDAGVTRITLLENIRRLEIDPTTINKIAISHGHGDHIAAMTDVLQAIDAQAKPQEWPAGTTPQEADAWLAKQGVTLVAHPDAFNERWDRDDDGKLWGPEGPPPRGAWEAAGARIVLSEGPYKLADGCWTTGAVPRRSFEQSGISTSMLERDGGEFRQDSLQDDQAIVINLRDKGLVVLSGCAHSGILNTVEYGQQISGVERVYAVIGGFHLARSEDEEIQRTVQAIQALEPTLVVPSHCTGFPAMRQFSLEMPEQFLPGVVGAKYIF